MTNLNHRTRAAVLAAVLGLAGTACSSEQIAERMAEGACRDQGQNCDIDIDRDGGIKIATDEGTLTMDADGNMTVRGADGELVQAVTGDDGAMTITDGSGNVVAQQDGDVLTVTGDDGTSVMVTGGDVPEQWPAAITIPPNSTVMYSNVVTTPEGDSLMLTVTTPGELGAVSAALEQSLNAAGFTQSFKTATAEAAMYMYEGDGTAVTVNVSPDEPGQVTVAYVVVPQA